MGDAMPGQSNGHAYSKIGKQLHFVIVGGSLGGLSTALALKHLGHKTTILERHPGELLHNQGAGIVAGGDSMTFLETYNRCKRAVAVSSQKRLYFDINGKIVNERTMVQNMTSWDLIYYLLRANYDGVQSDYCEVPEADPSHGDAVHLHGHTVENFEVKPSGGVRVYFKNTGSDTVENGRLDCDVLVAADGPSSTIRSRLFPDVKRTYAGYCALRGTVPEHDVSEDAQLAFRERFAFFHAPGIQILAYLIPGVNGTVEKGSRLINFVYYANFPEGSPELDEIMTDRHGKRHRITMPPGSIDPHAWEKQKRIAQERLPRQFAEIVCATKQPFVQAVTDVIGPSNTAYDDRVVLIGDSLAGFRPHTVASTSQACFDAMQYAAYVAGKISRAEWRRNTMGYARFVQKRGVSMGTRSQFGEMVDGHWAPLPLEELIKDRDEASKPLKDEVWPEWAVRLEDEVR